MSSGPVAVVLAGGASRRFGSDKLAAPLGGRSLLELVLDGLPAEADVLVVGPERDLHRSARFVRESPAGGGPAAALVTGVAEALAGGAEEIVVLPGDAPQAGHAAGVLLQALRQAGNIAAVVGTDASGFDQPLQLALRRRAAQQLVASGGPDRAAGQSARALVRQLDPPALRWPLPTADHFDVDTPEQLQAWRTRDSDAVRAVLPAVDTLASPDRTVVVALDGRSGSGKSTLASALALQRAATVIEGDWFYSPELVRLDQPARERLTDSEVAGLVIDWRRLRSDALEPLLRGHRADVAPYDWDADDGRLGRPQQLAPSGLLLLEGVYSTRPELADLVDLTVLVEVDPEIRRRRLARRDQDLPEWLRLWERGEDHYFTRVRPPESFDLLSSGWAPDQTPSGC